VFSRPLIGAADTLGACLPFAERRQDGGGEYEEDDLLLRGAASEEAMDDSANPTTDNPEQDDIRQAWPGKPPRAGWAVGGCVITLLVSLGLGPLPKLAVVSESGFLAAVIPFAAIALMLCLLGAMSLAVIALVWLAAAMVRRRGAAADWRATLLAVGACGVALASPYFAPNLTTGLADDVWLQTWESVARKGDTICEALSAYHAEHGEYPTELEALVPDHLAALPRPEVTRDRVFHYRPRRIGRDGLGGQFALWVNPRTTLLSSARFFYWPSEDYTHYAAGGRVELIGGWAYAHE